MYYFINYESQRIIKPFEYFQKDPPCIFSNRKNKIYSYAKWLLWL